MWSKNAQYATSSAVEDARVSSRASSQLFCSLRWQIVLWKTPSESSERVEKREISPLVGICWNPRLPQFFLSNLFCVVFVANWVDFSSAPFDLELPSTSYRVGLFFFLFRCVFAKSSLTCCFAPTSLQCTCCRTCHSQKSSIPTQMYCLVWQGSHGREVKVVILMCSIWHFIRP